MYCERILKAVLGTLLVSWVPISLAEDVAHAVAGVVTKVDASGKTITVKTAGGAEQVFKYTDRTSVTTAKKAPGAIETAGAASYLAGKEGTHVVLRYIGEGSEKTALSVKDFGDESLKAGKGTITHVDRAARSLTIKTEDGTEDTYHLSKDAAIDTEHGVTDASRYTAKEGDKILFHYTEEGGNKVVRFVKSI
jgi:Cu/Ag efflux protein CusF